MMKTHLTTYSAMHIVAFTVDLQYEILPSQFVVLDQILPVSTQY